VCRLYISKGPIDLSHALKLAARHDPYMPSEKKQHGDGWGFAAASRAGFMHYKSGIPAWEDPTAVPLREVVLAHARAASPGEPLGPAHAHPYMVYTPDGRILFVAHNGSVDKKAMAAEVGVDPSLYTDSYVLALFLARRWEAPQRAFEDSLRYVKTALNVAVLELPSLTAHVYTYYRGPREYYALYLIEEGEAKAVASSTLLRHLEARGRELENGTYLKF
jgi:predicted glutamine amidotransferase